MQYDFSSLFKGNDKTMLSEFIDEHTNIINSISNDNNTNKLIEIYESILHTFTVAFEEKDILNLFENLAIHEILAENHYVIVTN